MKFANTFLSSRIARRLFWLLLVAAAAPVISFGLVAQTSLSEFAANQEQRRLTESTKSAGQRLLDRLLMGRALLQLAASSGRLEAARSTVEGQSAFSAIAVVWEDGSLVSGDPALARAWRERTRVRPRPYGSAELVELNWHTGTTPAVLRLGVMNGGSPGMVWVGEFAPQYIWTDRADDDHAQEVCIFDGNGQALHCPAERLASARAYAQSRAKTDQRTLASWNLFLHANFGVGDWTLVGMAQDPMQAQSDPSLARLAALGALATLLAVVLLGLSQVRRTLDPLEQLTEGTRRLARHDYAARVTLRQDDEFGELADSFNHMAERVAGQFEALRVQSAIDREILDRLDVERVMQQVLERLAVLLGRGDTVLLESALPGADLVRLHRLGQATLDWSSQGLESPAPARGADLADGDDMPMPWTTPRELSDLLGAPAVCGRLQARWRGQVVATLLMRGPWPADADVRRELLGLRDRVAVTMAAARRERELLRRATHDSLTGLLNRNGLVDSLDAMTSARRRDQAETEFSVLFIDLDRLKEVNDSLGHQAGDELLVQVTARLRALFSPDTQLARAGGDEFVAIIPGMAAKADHLAGQICTELARPFGVAGNSCIIGASIGLARYPTDARSRGELMRRADMAMYAAKAAGRSRHAWFDLAMDEKQAQRARLGRDLQWALLRNEFELHFQPRVDAHSGRILSAEVLLRWRHPRLGEVSPLQFIDLLEETGAIETVGRWMLLNSCAQLARWRALGADLPRLAINVSGRQLRNAALAGEVLDTLATHGLKPTDLEIELTEGVLMGDAPIVLGQLQQLRQQGIRVAIDDFGTGYSSLSSLGHLPVDVIKVDRSFVQDALHGDAALRLTRGIMAMARALDKRVVAEGVELEAQAQLMRELGAHELQGFLYSAAVPARTFEQMFLSCEQAVTEAGAL